MSLEKYEADIGLWEFADQGFSFVEVKKNDKDLYDALLQAALYTMQIYSKYLPRTQIKRTFKVAAVSLPKMRFRLGTITLSISARKKIEQCEFKMGGVKKHIKKSVIGVKGEEDSGPRWK
eukprot:GHVP01004327.1.p1 GENE.GHVP01004327.1~~GHVP01004327.1.p1  ORF type:complete len:120 (+),score=16.35 GHVP01004327.1:2124-2483(+)